MTVEDIYHFLNEKAPFSTAEEWDNTGLLVGDPQREVARVLTVLDITPNAVETAQRLGAQLIVSHHPVIFSPLRRLESSSIPYALAQADIAAVCAHTNLDRAAGGVNDTLASLLGLRSVQPMADGLCRMGVLPEPLTPEAFARHTGLRLDTAVRLAAGSRPVSRVALCSGSGGEFLSLCAGEADAFVTGEIKHHEWLRAAGSGLTRGGSGALRHRGRGGGYLDRLAYRPVSRSHLPLLPGTPALCHRHTLKSLNVFPVSGISYE